MNYQLLESLFPLNPECTAVERILANRGIKPENVEHYLYTTDRDIINPNLLNNIEQGVKILINHIAKENDVFILVDPDADGFTSAAVLINYLNCLFPSFTQNHIHYGLHTGKQHGLNDYMDYLNNHQDFKLIICPDSSSNDYEEHKILKSAGRDILVLDHHPADYISQDACVINNQLSDYPTKSLSGVGIVYKFCSYIDEVLGVKYSDQFLDLVAIGMVGDMMSLKDYETKHLIQKGLNSIHNLFVETTIQKQDYSISRAGGLCPFSVSFFIVPLINATIRMGTMEEKLILFESMIDFLAEDLIPSTKRGCKGQYETRVEQACRNCNNIKNRQTKARDASLSLIEQKIEEYDLTKNKILVIKIKKSDKIERTISRLIANQLCSKYQQPVLVLNEVIDPETNETTWEGSAAGYQVPQLEDFRSFMKSSDYVFLAEGHPNAFGAGIKDEYLDSFIEESNLKLQDCIFQPLYKVDFIWDFNNFNPNDILKIAELNTIWGQEVEKPYIAIERIAITKDNLELLSPDKSPTLKITLANGTCLIKFRSSKEEYETLYSDLGCVTINIVGTCNINEWNGKISPQVIIEDYEITGKNKYYF